MCSVLENNKTSFILILFKLSNNKLNFIFGETKTRYDIYVSPHYKPSKYLNHTVMSFFYKL